MLKRPSEDGAGEKSVITAMAPFAGMPQLSDEDFALICDLLYKKAGISMKPTKKLLVQNRLRPRMKALGLVSFREYYRRAAIDPKELQEFLDALTTNETFFFREEKHWDYLRETILQEVKLRCASASFNRTFSIWSAASSTGEELYTAAIVLMEYLPDPQSWNLRLVGTDINAEVVAKARAAVYKPYALKTTQPRIVDKYFSKEKDAHGGDLFRLKEQVKKICSFRTHNLLEPFAMKNFDLVICRNVFIYFDAAAKARIVGNLADSCAAGGHIFFSHTEAMIPKTERMENVRPSIYRVKAK